MFDCAFDKDSGSDELARKLNALEACSSIYSSALAENIARLQMVIP